MKKQLLTILIYALLAALLYFALRNAPLEEIWQTLKSLRPWQIFALLLANIFIYSLITLRWWIIVRAEQKNAAYLPLIPARLAVFGVSYFTPGPQVGGEPLQILYLQRKYKTTYTHAAAVVITDKLLEFLANFLIFGAGFISILQMGLLSLEEGNFIIIGIIPLLLLPPLHLFLMWQGKRPLSFLARKIAHNKLTRFISAAEHLAGRFCQRRLPYLLSAAAVSMLASSSMVAEYFLVTHFFGLNLTFNQITAAWTVSGLAFLLPLPGGVGALEASQVFALGAFGVSAASAISVTLLMRARDLLIGGIGLLLAGRLK